MAKLKTVYRCSDCGGTAPKWAGRCGGCGAWNTLAEDVELVGGPSSGATAHGGPMALAPAHPVVPITEVDASQAAPSGTGIPELDRVLGGGLVAGSVTLIGGEPGIGKSTLLLAVASAQARVGKRVLYVSAEESAQQVRARAERLGSLSPSLWLASETLLPHLVGAIDAVEPDLVIVDSIQTIADPELGSAPGSIVQVRECAYRLVREAKERGTAIVLVGHVTKDGNLAGPRVLEHVVDTVLAFEGDRHHALRLLRAVKHRFGPTTELGVFEMTDRGLTGVADPSGLFLADRRPGIPGSAVVPTVEGQRPLLVEVQALVPESTLAVPRRSAQGVDQGRVALLVAVLEERAGVSFAKRDVYVSAVGGVRLAEPGSDLALALALVGARYDQALAPDLVAIGEVGLGGEIRQASGTERRLAEAARLGFRHAIVPPSAPARVAGLTVHRVPTLAQAIAHAGLRGRPPAPPVDEPF